MATMASVLVMAFTGDYIPANSVIDAFLPLDGYQRRGEEGNKLLLGPQSGRTPPLRLSCGAIDDW
jgi:hypothetical protein